MFPAAYTGTATVNGKIITQSFTIPNKGHDEKESVVD
jgi:hypothetical protein